jgi:hypothetical protein
MFNIITIESYIAEPTISPFRWGLDFNHWVPWILHYPLRPRMHNHPMHKPKSKKPLGSFNQSNTSANMFRIFCRSPIPSTRNTMINTGFHTCFRWEIKFGFTYKKNTLQDPIRSFVHSDMNLTPSPRLWVTMFLSSTFTPSLSCTQCLMWTSLATHLFQLAHIQILFWQL